MSNAGGFGGSGDERFALSVVLYDEMSVVPFGPKLFAAPISSLWS